MYKKSGLFALFLSLISVTVWAVGPVGTAPLNPDFVNYMEARALGETAVDVARGLGHVPPPYRLPPFTEEQDRQLLARALPTSFDLRTAGKVTAIRDQGQEGACWSFAAYGSMESCLLVKNAGTWDFSENHMVNLHGGDWGRNDGGNEFLATAYLARWTGPVLETEDPYPSTTSPAGLRPRKHIQQVIYLPARRSAGDNNAIKQALMDYGALYTSMYAGNYLNEATAGYYYNGTKSPNHAVTIVGWDDNYSKNNFKTTPPGNGAFIVKNSWGTGWGASGYFYASYHDTKFGSENAAFMNAEATSNYDKVYQYDPLGMVTGFGYNDSVI
ncbi:MAG: hypothetical protein LC725_02435, partial [Lentisphaerae bacterium]|nr:hypothetical protein [Lentisphaerota bacterium]